MGEKGEGEGGRRKRREGKERGEVEGEVRRGGGEEEEEEEEGAGAAGGKWEPMLPCLSALVQC